MPNAQSAAPTFPIATSTALALGVAAVTVAVMAILLLPLPARASPGRRSTPAPDDGVRTTHEWAPRGSNPEPAD